MKKIIMIGSLALSSALFGFFVLTGEGALLVYILLGLLISFIYAMLFLAGK